MPPPNPTIEEMVRKYLETHGYDGLCNLEIECGCGIDDLFPCGDPDHEECQAAYARLSTCGLYQLYSPKKEINNDNA